MKLHDELLLYYYAAAPNYYYTIFVSAGIDRKTERFAALCFDASLMLSSWRAQTYGSALLPFKVRHPVRGLVSWANIYLKGELVGMLVG